MARGYFGIGVEGISKAYNLGAVLRTAHAFDASFAFSIGADPRAIEVRTTDTSRSKIPTKFCLNVSLAAALTLYDRALCFGGYTGRPLPSHLTPRQRRKKSAVDQRDIAHKSR